MKEADQLYRTVGENQEKFHMYQVRNPSYQSNSMKNRLHNFVDEGEEV